MADLSGRQFGPYRIEESIGSGGMAVVYKAYQPSMERYVALKILPQDLATETEFVGRFRQEARLLAGMQHPHILPIFDFGEREGYTYIVMPFVKSDTLADKMQGTPLDIEQATRIVTQIGEALDYAHSRGLVHRDIKPSNILLDEQGNAVLTDFGIAKLYEATSGFTNTGGVIGTPSYMSPEQGQGAKVDQRTDIYSLGVVFFEMVTGRVPFQADTPIAVVLKHITEPLLSPRALNPSVPLLIDRVIARATAKDPARRFHSALALVRALQSGDAQTVALDESAPSAPDSAPPATGNESTLRQRITQGPRRWFALGGLAFLVLLFSVGAGVLWALQRSEASVDIPVTSDTSLAADASHTTETTSGTLEEPTGSSSTPAPAISATKTPPATEELVEGNQLRIEIIAEGEDGRTEVTAVGAGQLVTVQFIDGGWSAGPAPVWPLVGPEGDPQIPDKASFPLPSEPLMALVGGIGDGQPFLLQPGVPQPAPADGILWVGPNDDDTSDNGGALTLEIIIEEGAADATLALAGDADASEPAQATTPTATVRPLPTPSATSTAPPLGPETVQLGQSAAGQPVEAVRFGNGPSTVVFVGGIHAGFAPGSVRLAQNTVQHFTENPDNIPSSATVYVVLSLNPDSEHDPGRLPGRLNANGVDLNRNWNCSWTQNPAVDNQTVFGAGGVEPFSEPETRALSDFLLEIEPRAVVFWEARAVPGMVIPGACGPTSEVSNPLAPVYAQAAGYRWQIVENFSGVIVRGDASNWLDLQGIPAIFVLTPSFSDPDWNRNLPAILAIVREFGR